ncbi:MAG: CBS domain-containing protein, partial [Polyangiales bacterium]
MSSREARGRGPVPGPFDLIASEAIDRVRESARHARYNLYIVDRDDRLIGVLNMRELMLAKPRARMESIMRREVIRISSEMDTPAVLGHPGWHEVHAVP